MIFKAFFLPVGIGVEVIQTVIQIDAAMNLSADHLTLSRHGIWYYRWVVPPTVRTRLYNSFVDGDREPRSKRRGADARCDGRSITLPKSRHR